MKIRFGLKAMFPLLLLTTAAIFLFSCISQGAAQADEYFSIGMAYFEMGKYSEAEMWLNRARVADKTMVASEYNLGRIAFETGRYQEAARYFERILDRDTDNLLALKAAAYSRIKNGNIEAAEALYNRVLALVPESADDGFNYALVLYGLEKYENCEGILKKYPFALDEKPASVLLLARAQKAQEKIEALDSYAKWVIINTEAAVNPQGLYEYAQVLETAGFYARALEQYNDAIAAVSYHTELPKKSTIRFERARLLLTADPENGEGMTEFSAAVSEGFSDTDAIWALLRDERITVENRDEIRDVLDNMLDKEQKKPETEDE